MARARVRGYQVLKKLQEVHDYLGRLEELVRQHLIKRRHLSPHFALKRHQLVDGRGRVAPVNRRNGR